MSTKTTTTAEEYLRTSERNLFKRCQWAWERSYIDRLDARKESKALWFGTGIHLALEEYYVIGTERGVDPVETWEEYCNQTRGDTESINLHHGGDGTEVVNAMELGSAMLKEYVSHYGPEPHLEVIATERTFNVGVKYQAWKTSEEAAHLEPETANYVGTIDLVVRDLMTNKIWLWDHKTAGRLGSENTQYLPLDDQAGSYLAIADLTLRKSGLISSKERIHGIVYNYLVKKKPDSRPRNEEGFATNTPIKKHYIAALEKAGLDELGKLKLESLKELAESKEIEVFGDVSSVQPSPMFERKKSYRTAGERKSQIQRVQLDLQAMSLVRNGVVPATKTPTRECGFCEFREICELDEAGRDWSDMANIFHKKWSPYEAHLEDKV